MTGRLWTPPAHVFLSSPRSHQPADSSTLLEVDRQHFGGCGKSRAPADRERVVNILILQPIRWGVGKPRPAGAVQHCEGNRWGGPATRPASYGRGLAAQSGSAAPGHQRCAGNLIQHLSRSRLEAVLLQEIFRGEISVGVRENRAATGQPYARDP
jgi:hypothetical protein